MTRFMNKTRHAYLDYPVALGLIAMPFPLGLGAVNPLAMWLSVVAGLSGKDAVYYWGLGATVLVVVALDNTQEMVPAQ